MTISASKYIEIPIDTHDNKSAMKVLLLLSVSIFVAEIYFFLQSSFEKFDTNRSVHYD